MSIGLIALLDDVAAMAKLAAASIDDVGAAATRAGAKAAGVVIDAVRIIKLALNNGISGQLDGASSYLMKSPHTQRPDDEAREKTEEFIAEYGRGRGAVAAGVAGADALRNVPTE